MLEIEASLRVEDDGMDGGVVRGIPDQGIVWLLPALHSSSLLLQQIVVGHSPRLRPMFQRRLHDPLAG